MTGRRWRDKFADAFRGVGQGVREQRSFRVHLPVAGLVLVAAAALRCDAVEWAALLLCVGLVLTTELVNSSVETLFHALDDATKNRMVGCLDQAAGAVLLASGTAVAVGAVVFGRRVLALFSS